MLELASILGTRVEVRWLRRLWDSEREGSTEQLDQAIKEATRAGVVERAESPRLLRFHHGLLRKTVYRTVAPDRLGRLHWQAGLIGAGATEPMSPATVAAHLVRGVAAGSSAQALDACASAAREASSRGAFDAAAALWRQALDMLALHPSATASEEAVLRIQLAKLHTPKLGITTAKSRRLDLFQAEIQVALHESAWELYQDFLTN
jgi:hypothetical protein